MLVLSRKVGESVDIDGQIIVRVVGVRGNRVQVGIEAPKDIQILRSELSVCHSTDNEWESEEKTATKIEELTLLGKDT